MDRREDNNKDTIICFLVVNYIPFLPTLSIGSCLAATDCSIVVGYIHEDDLRELPISQRITRLNLQNVPGCGQILTSVHSGDYKKFGTQDFFNLVQLKWYLFAELMSQGFQRVIYSDIDTLWVQDAVKMTQLEEKNLLLQIQDATLELDAPMLCMGFVSMLNSPTIIQMIDECARENQRRLLAGEKIGDDDIITEFYSNHSCPTWIKPLPQLAFPTGNMVTQYLARSSFRPIEPPKPILFHANYVIGQKKKAILLFRLVRHWKLPIETDIYYRGRLLLWIGFYMVRVKFWYDRAVRISARYLSTGTFRKEA